MTHLTNRLLSGFATITLFLGILATAHADDLKTEFGPYVALTRDANIVRDVKVEDNGRIYLLLNPDFKEKEIILKNSMGLKEGYRNWFNGQQELVSAANQGKAPNEYTDWVTTTANYVEYYMDNKLILHLAKKSVANK